MPIVFETAQPWQKVAVWHISESEDVLYDMYVSFFGNLHSDIENAHPNRRISYLSSRVLLAHMQMDLDIPIKVPHKNEFGAPILPYDRNISISHTKEYAAILLSQKQHSGIDIQSIEAKVRSTIPRICSDKELSLIDDSIESQTALWCCKETLYKAYGKKQISMKEQISIELINSKTAEGQVLHAFKSTMEILRLNDNTFLVYTL